MKETGKNNHARITKCELGFFCCCYFFCFLSPKENPQNSKRQADRQTDRLGGQQSVCKGGRRVRCGTGTDMRKYLTLEGSQTSVLKRADDWLQPR